MARWTNTNPCKNLNGINIPFYDGYKLTSDFKVIGKTGRYLSEIDTNNTGYKFVNVRINGKNGILYLHRAIALVHVSGYFEGAYVDHKDGNPFNYDPTNLRWVTPSENTRYSKFKARFKLSKIQMRIKKLEKTLEKLKNEEQLIKKTING